MFRQYVYISTASSLSETDVEDILSSSRRNNPKLGITGMLLFNGRNFIQLIEGEEENLIQLISKISGDPRHEGLTFVYADYLEERTCPGWDMKRLSIVESVSSRKEKLAQELPAGLKPDLRTLILNFAVLN